MQSSKCTALSVSIHLNCLNLGLFECAQNASIHLKVESQAAIHWNERSYLSLSLSVNFSRGRENERAKESGKDWCENIQTFMITKWNAFLPFTLIQNVCYFGFASFRAIQIEYIYIYGMPEWYCIRFRVAHSSMMQGFCVIYIYDKTIVFIMGQHGQCVLP